MCALCVEAITFDDFCDICRKEPATTEEDLMRAFRKIDVNGDGFISNSELRKMLTTVKITCLSVNVFKHCIPRYMARNFLLGVQNTMHFLQGPKYEMISSGVTHYLRTFWSDF